MLSSPQGKYRTYIPESGAEYAYVDYGTNSSLGAISRILYEENGYQPPFGKLLTRRAYERSQESANA